MKIQSRQLADEFFARRDDLNFMREQINTAVQVLTQAFKNGNKLLLCGNGGSCADCEHIAGELLKGFLLKRPVCPELADAMEHNYGETGKQIASKLQQGLPAISLGTHSGAISAFANDVDAELVYAQQVLAYGCKGDLLLGISTSGNANNVAAAVMTAKTLGMYTIGLTGKDGGKLAELSDLALTMPQMETYRIQEDHLAVYHLLCAMIEHELFDC